MSCAFLDSGSATVERDLKLDTFNICLFLNKNYEQPIECRKVPLRGDKMYTSFL